MASVGVTIYIEDEYSSEGLAFLSREEYTKVAEDITKEILELEKCPYEAEVSLLLTNDRGIRKINNEERSIDSSTDVLSFPMISFEKPADFKGMGDNITLFDPDTGRLVLGDIVISVDHCIAQAASYGHSLKREYAFLIAHSMLHLLGYDHEDPVDEQIMIKKQEEALGALHISR